MAMLTFKNIVRNSVYHSTLSLRSSMQCNRTLSGYGFTHILSTSTITTQTTSVSSFPSTRSLFQPPTKSSSTLFLSQQYRSFGIKRKFIKKGSKTEKEHITNMLIPRQIGGMDNEVRLVFPDGSNKVMKISDALIRGQEENLDIVLFQANANPPTCKILDLGFHKYNLRKKEAEKRKNAPLPVKTIKFKVKIEKGDFQRKVNEARNFLSKGHSIRLSIVLLKNFIQGEDRAAFLHNEFIKAVKDLIVESSTSGGLNKDSAQRTCEIHPKIAEEEDATSKKH